MTDVEIIPAGIVDLLNEPEMLAVLDHEASAISHAAAGITRRGHRDRHHIADEYDTEKATATPQGGRAAAVNTSSFYHLEAFGTAHQAPGRMFERAVTQTGNQLEVLPKS